MKLIFASVDMQRGNGNPLRLLVLAAPDVQSAARWGVMPADARANVVGDPYAAAIEVVRGGWDALVVDPGFLSAGTVSLIDGSVRLRGLKVWIFETAANPVLFQQALKAGAVPLSNVFRSAVRSSAALTPRVARVKEEWEQPEPKMARAGEEFKARVPQTQPTPEPENEMTDEEAIRAALGYDREMPGSNGKKRHTMGVALDTIIESCSDPDQPVLTDAELRALLGEDQG